MTINVAMLYMAIQKIRGDQIFGSALVNKYRWKTSLALINIGAMGMTIALLVAGYQQAFIERAVEGSTWSGFFEAQSNLTFIASMNWRLLFGVLMTIGTFVIAWDLLTIGKTNDSKDAT